MSLSVFSPTAFLALSCTAFFPFAMPRTRSHSKGIRTAAVVAHLYGNIFNSFRNALWQESARLPAASLKVVYPKSFYYIFEVFFQHKSFFKLKEEINSLFIECRKEWLEQDFKP